MGGPGRWLLAGVVALALPGAPGPAGPAGRLAFQIHGRAEGLGHVSLTSLAQDANGFIWAGTEGGAYRYDGAAFRHWGLHEGLPSSWVECFLPDPDGSLWIGTRRGLARFRFGKVAAVGEPAGLAGAEVKSLARDARGQLWAATDRGLFVRSAGGPFLPAPDGPQGKCYSAAPAAEGLWVGAEDGLHRLSGGRWERVEAGLPAAPVKAVAEDGAGRVWARTASDLYVRRQPGGLFVRLDAGPVMNTIYEEQLVPDGQGGLWVPTVQGLLHLGRDGSEVRLGLDRGLPTPWANVALVDREGGLWAGGVGLYQQLGLGDWRTYGQADGLPADNIWGLHRDLLGVLWVATARGLARLGPEGFQAVPGTQGEVLYAFAERDGELWAAGEQPYLDRFRLGRAAPERVPLPPDPAAPVAVSLAFDAEGALWIGTSKAGLLRRAPDGALTRVPVPGLPPDGQVVSVQAAEDGSLWVASDAGLAVRSPGGRWRAWGVAAGLKAAPLWGLARMPDGSAWIAYQEPLGLTHLRVSGDRLEVLGHLDAASGLGTDSIYSLGAGAGGMLWAGTNDGVARVAPGGAIARFGRAQGLAGEDCNPFSLWADPGGDVWIGTTGGLEHHLAGADAAAHGAPPAEILSVQAGGAVEDGPFEARARLPEAPAAGSPVQVQFSTLDYAQAGALQYQVRLLGLEADWRATRLHEARYPALPPGSYRFQVRTLREDGATGPVSEIAFEVPAPWWRRRAFLAFEAAAFLALVWAWLRLRTRRLRRRNEELERLVRDRTEALELSNLALEAISMTDPLTALGNRRRLEQALPVELSRAQRRHRELLEGKLAQLPPDAKLAIVMLDIDRFKSVNDTYGHAGGDAVLAQVAERIRGVCRGTDLPIRWGGEEFLVVAHVADFEAACAFTERLARALRERAFALPDGKDLLLTASLGFALFPFIATDPEAVAWDDCVAIADRCLYAAKHSGRDRWVGVAAEDGATPEDVAGFRWDPEQALQSGQFQLRAADGTRRLFWG